MFDNIAFDKISLRKKIVLLALIPALAACIIFGALVATSSRTASTLVRTNILDFMIYRTEKSLDHGYATSVTAAGYVEDKLRLDAKIASLDTMNSLVRLFPTPYSPTPPTSAAW